MVRTLVFAVLLVMGSLALVTAAVAAFRRQRHLGVYASGYASGMVGLWLLSTQGWLPPALSVVAANLLLCWFPLSLFVGLRLWLGSPTLWPWRYTGYLVALGLALVAGLTLWPSYLFRSQAVAALTIVGTVDVIATAARSVRHLPRALAGALWAVGIGFLACNVARLVLLGLPESAATTMMADTPANLFNFSYSLVFCVIWVGLVLIIDSAELVAALEAKNAELGALATTDVLTGAGNRQALQALVAEELSRAGRHGQPLSLVLFDLDSFKVVNDTWGHETGDAVLRESARAVETQLRASDHLSRWGGEEFVVLCPETDLEGAWTLAEKLRAALASVRHPLAGTVTASFGVAEWDRGSSWETWFRRADQALYRAKAGGRNRVEVWVEPLVEAPLRLKLEWATVWESGHPAVDADHRHLVELANELLDLAAAPGSSARLDRSFQTLRDHIADHFAQEEAVLDEVGYPDAGAHRDHHGVLLAEMRSLEEAHRRGELTALALVQFVVSQVILDHMLTDDAAFFGYTRAPGPESRLVRSRS